MATKIEEATLPRRRGRPVSGTALEERLNFRLARSNRLLIEQAAALEGKNLKEFVQGAAIAEARRVLVERSILTMESDERDAFLALLETSPAPTHAAQAAAARWREWKRTGVIPTSVEPAEPAEPKL